MKVNMVDTRTGNPAGDFEIPDEIISAAFAVYDWMRANAMTQLAGLTLSDLPDGLCQRRRAVPKREPTGG